MTAVHVTTYEVVGDGIALADEHYAQLRAARAAHWAVATKFGAHGYRPSSGGGGIYTLFFKGSEPPAGFRLVGRVGESVECAPRKGSKVGNDALAAFSAPGLRSPSDCALAAMFGFHEMPTDGRSLFFATSTRVLAPSPRTFLRLPRTATDGWPGHEHLMEVPESTFMLALETHNAAARAAKEAAQ